MNKIARFHQSLTNINFEMLFAYITSAAKDNNYYNNCWAFFQDLLIFLMENQLLQLYYVFLW